MIRWGTRTGCALALVFATSALAAQTPSSPEQKARRPTTVSADHLEVSLKERRAIYTGNVIAKTTDLTVSADRMEFKFDEKMEAVERMVATGNVRIAHREGQKARAERAIYDVLQEKVVLEGHAKAWREENMVEGMRITLFLKEDRQVVEGDEDERVTATIYPKQKSEQAR